MEDKIILKFKTIYEIEPWNLSDSWQNHNSQEKQVGHLFFSSISRLANIKFRCQTFTIKNIIKEIQCDDLSIFCTWRYIKFVLNLMTD